MKANIFAKLRRNRQKKRAEEADKKHLPRLDYLLDDEAPFALTESFRNLKASLTVAIPRKEGDGGVALMITSNYPEEGKTTVAANLAVMFAKSDAKIVLVDADIRKGRVNKFFGERHKPGLSDYLSGQAKEEEILHRSQQSENLYVICQGTASPRPYELLESETMKKLIADLKGRFDYVIVDTPPIQLVSDALAIVPVMDGTVLVCRHMSTYESDIRNSLETLGFAKANVLGVVVNDFTVPSQKYGNGKKYYYSYYKYGYGGDGEKSGKKDGGNAETEKSAE